MKYVKQYESFYNKSKESIDIICKRYNIIDYIVNDDFSLDVDGNVDLSNSGNEMGQLPLTFNHIRGNFDCIDNNLTSLKGIVKRVDGTFDVTRNKLKTLEGCPEIGRNLVCTQNQLESTKGCPQSLNGLFLGYNNLTTLEGLPEKLNGELALGGNRLTSLKGCPKTVSILYVQDNNLTTLEGCPNASMISAIRNNIFTFDGFPNTSKIVLDENPIDKIINLFLDGDGPLEYDKDYIKTIVELNDTYKFIRSDNIVVKSRLEEAIADSKNLESYSLTNSFFIKSIEKYYKIVY